MTDTDFKLKHSLKIACLVLLNFNDPEIKLSSQLPSLPDNIFGVLLGFVTPREWCTLRRVSRSINGSCIRSLTFSPELVRKMLRAQPNPAILSLIFERCTNIEEVRITDSRLTNEEVYSLPYPANLQRLDLTGRDVTAAGLARILNRMPSLQRITVQEIGTFSRECLDSMTTEDRNRILVNEHYRRGSGRSCMDHYKG